jgi:hypothetical protein
MARRASSMVRLERARLVSFDPPVSHSLDAIDRMSPVWSRMPDKLLAGGVVLSPHAQTSLVSDTCCWLTLMGDASRYGDQFAFPLEGINRNLDYVLIVPIAAFSGRMKVSVKSSNGRIYSSAIVEAPEIVSPGGQLQQIVLPIVPHDSGQLQVVFSNEASNSSNPIVEMTEVRLYELGPARFLWTRYPRFIVHGIQKIFLTAVILPLAIIGLLLLIFRKQSRALVILSVVPVYFFLVQSTVHTEYRYVLALDYFLFAFAAAAIAWIGSGMIAKVRGRRSWLSLR